MKIGHSADKTHGAPAANGSAAATGSAQAQATGAPRAIPDKADDSAKIQLSKTASSLLDGGSSSAEFDADKVASISKSIDDGTFKVNPGAIADKLISGAHELLTRSQS